MSKEFDTRQSLQVNLFLFYVFYFFSIMVEKQIVRSGLLGFKFPTKIGIPEYAIGFIAGTAIISLLTLVLNSHQYLVRISLMVLLFSSTIFINYFNSRLFYPPFTEIAYNDLGRLAEHHWNRLLPFDLYDILSDEYPLAEINLNPALEDFDLFRQIGNLGLYVRITDSIPSQLSTDQFVYLEMNTLPSYSEIKQQEITYRIYYSDQKDDEIFLTQYKNIIIIAPLSSLN